MEVQRRAERVCNVGRAVVPSAFSPSLVPTVESFTASHDPPFCSHNSLGKRGGRGELGREGSPWRERCLQLNQIYII